MVLSKRERYAALACGLALAVLALDRLILAPITSAYADIDTDKRRLLKALRDANELQMQRTRAVPLWQGMLKSGMKADPAAAESQVSEQIHTWAQRDGLTLTLVKPERVTEKTKLPEIVFQTTGTGSMNAIAQLLYQVQTAAIPVKVNDVTITPRKEGTDDLTVVMHISTICSPGQSLPGAGPMPASAASGGR